MLDDFKQFVGFVSSGAWLQAFFLIGAILILYTFWKVQRGDNRIDFKDILIGDDGKASGSKIMQLGAFLASTWGFIYIIVHNTLTEWYFTSFMVAWSGSQLLSRWIAIREHDRDHGNDDIPDQINQRHE